MTGRVSIPELRKLHAAPNYVLGNGRVASQPQLDEYYAMHDAFPALVEAVEAARATAPFLPQIHRDALNRYLCRFDFGNETT